MSFNHRVPSPKFHALKKRYFNILSTQSFCIHLTLGGDEIMAEEEEVEVEILVVVVVVVEIDIFVLCSKKIPTFDST